ncbi:outer membrane beta-barrel protein [Flavivirga amylovorans]|uniref:Outer membrane beta-barrel protein n=1 Tax=Flavivirga amylovorans TaxID=870486 RepID=A0ABT8X777_9FLAO|nr:outer membrane beta-barrel protein [Flavivirga amylovorans]MDO5989543.1 outer membrane beta-barrel protein [Flavivirga amylovorans]
MKYCFFVFTILYLTASFAQTKPFKISGTLISETDKIPLEAATIYLERVKDSSLVTYTISDKNGIFSLEGKTTDTHLNFYVSYVGYQTHYQTIHLDQEITDLKTISLKTDLNALEEVFIKVSPPVVIKKDTLKFNASSFKTKKDANVEDLLKQLPGVDVNEAGKITINGKEVDNILVNGKPFFSNDPTITTRHLSKEIIENIQITDTKTKAEAFAGDEGDREKKTINLVIKKENNDGVFGQVATGIGTDKRYKFAGMLNLFNNDQRISLLAGGNNINSPGFSFGGGLTNGQGITVSQNYGANYVDKLKDKSDISSNYFFSNSSTENENTVQRVNILPDSRYNSNSNTKSYSESDNHNVNLGFNIELDSTLLIHINPSFNVSKNNTETSGSEASRDEENTLTNQSSTSSFSEALNKNFSNHLSITKRFGKKGAYLRFNISNTYNVIESDDFLNTEIAIFGDNPETINRDQFTDGDQKSKSINTSTTFRWPLLSKALFLDLKFNYRHDKQQNIKSTFAFDPNTQDFTQFDEELSTDFKYTNKRSTPALRLAYKKEKWSVSSEAGYVFRSLQNNDLLRPQLSLARNFETIELRSNFQYQFNPKSYAYASYGLDNVPPQLSQLQPFQDISNPLNTVTGNPNLKPTNTHSFYFGYNTFNFQKRNGFFSYIYANLSNNQIVTKTTIDENFVRNTSYSNVDGGYTLSASSSYNKTIKIDSLKTFKYNVGLSASINKSVNFNNDVQYASNNTALTPHLGITFAWDNVMMIVPNYRLSFNKTTFDLDDFENQEFINHSAGLQITTFVPKNFEWRHDINFNYNPNVGEGFQKSAWFWNTTLAYTMFKDQGTLSLKIYDLLNQNTNARRIATQNYIQDSQSTVLKQYFMFSFNWKFNNF